MNKIIPDVSIHHIALRAANFNRSLEFYKALGMEVRASWVGAAGNIALLDIGNGTCIELFGGGDEYIPEGHFFHLAIGTSDVDTAFAAALAAGAKPTREPCDMVLPANPPLPVRLCFVEGPDGESLEFFCPKEN